MSKKSILEQALLQVQDLEEAVKANAKGILASTMKEELNEVLKESLEEEDVEGPEGVEEDMPISEQPFGDEEEGNDDEASINDEPSDDDIDPDLEGGDEDMGMDSEEDSEEDDLELPSMDDEGEDDEVLDMTDASDEEVMKVFKSMKPEDGIVVKKDGGNIELEDGDDEYIIKLDGDEEEVAEGDWNEEEECHECGDSAMEEEVTEDETVYEIDLGDDDDEEISEELSEDDAEMEVDADSEGSEEGEVESDIDEASRTMGNDVRGEGPRQGKKYKSGRAEINEEVETLKKQNAEYKKALVLFKEKLNEVAVFNANLAYATRLFTEHSTTRQEKLDILKRFDSVSSLTESKSTYKTIAGELGSKKNIAEAVVNKIASTPTTSSSQEVLSEAKAYESPQFKRMKDLMSKLK
jgi:hypothetical protein